MVRLVGVFQVCFLEGHLNRSRWLGYGFLQHPFFCSVDLLFFTAGYADERGWLLLRIFHIVFDPCDPRNPRLKLWIHIFLYISVISATQSRISRELIFHFACSSKFY